ncbi:MAG: PLDc N-terminal domain-containing protein [Dermatophilaceae bacterium]
MLRYVPVLLSLALTVYCVVDTIQTDDARVQHLPKIAWLILILLFPVVGPAAWLCAGRPRRRPRPLAPPRGPRGPDDDPDFLGQI